MKKKVFIVIVTYNGARWVDKNINSLLQSHYPVEIIVIDNCSLDDTVVLLQKYKEIEIIQSDENLGFGKANTIGMKEALLRGAQYVFLLNQDAWVFPDTIGSLVGVMEKNTQFGILSPLHYSSDGKNYDQAFNTYLSRAYSDLKDINTVTVPFVNAAAWMLSRECVEKVGYFEPLFGHYGEDRNYCDRVKYHGFLIGINHDAKIIHDRVIKRNLKKDIIQSKYKVLTTLLNINYSFFRSCMFGFKEVMGLPKYFFKFYGPLIAFRMFLILLYYYTGLLFKSTTIKSARKRARVYG
ncbi:glycosyltransferase family 2 protein [Flavobacterium sp. D11R37]|nr:glycosyltransferase family 2 protein [Flavobacterium coralii]